jgi:hypothetical protein
MEQRLQRLEEDIEWLFENFTKMGRGARGARGANGAYEAYGANEAYGAYGAYESYESYEPHRPHRPYNPHPKRLVEVPRFFVDSLYNDVPRYNRLISLLRGDIQSAVNNHKKKELRWWHVHKVLEDRGLIYKDLPKKRIGEALKTILGCAPKADTLRKKASNDTFGNLEHQNFHDWPENIFDKCLCMEVEQQLIQSDILPPVSTR